MGCVQVAEDDNLRLAKKLKQIDVLMASLSHSQNKTLYANPELDGSPEGKQDPADDPKRTRSASEIHVPRMQKRLTSMTMLLGLGGMGEEEEASSSSDVPDFRRTLSMPMKTSNHHEQLAMRLHELKQQEEMHFAGFPLSRTLSCTLTLSQHRRYLVHRRRHHLVVSSWEHYLNRAMS